MKVLKTDNIAKVFSQAKLDGLRVRVNIEGWRDIVAVQCGEYAIENSFGGLQWCDGSKTISCVVCEKR